MGWRRDEIVAATGGKLLREGSRPEFGEVVTDSGKVKKGSVFIALKGERHDGHQFVETALRRGADCIVVHRDLARANLGNATVIRVPDTLRALGDLAHFRREKIAPKVLAITGSNGKTTTKEMVAAIFERASMNGRPLKGRVLKTEGNFNNLVGLPLTLLRLRSKHRVAIVELGTNRPGEIERLTEIADPDVGIITSVAAAHLEGLNSLAGVAREKGALYRGVRAGGMIAVNLDDPWVRRLSVAFKGRKVTYGQGGQVGAELSRPLNARGMLFTLRAGDRRSRVRLKLCGEHNLANAIGAAAIAYGQGLSLNGIRRGLESVKPYSMRMQIETWKGVGVINDAYNANPASMQAALGTLAEIDSPGEKIAVLGDMLELGNHSRREHFELGKQIGRLGIDRLYLLGKAADQVRKGALRAGMPTEKIVLGKSHDELGESIRGHLRKGDWLLFKGSRGMKMEAVLQQLKGVKAAAC
ncbi:MAG: UDP-N-acetylmuramoyl-tripeptide--D-alanyl-D-alanine ligase [Candidatus Binatia bacterium]